MDRIPTPTLYTEAKRLGLVTGSRCSVTGELFIDQTTGEPRIDVPFAFDPYWETIAAKRTDR